MFFSLPLPACRLLCLALLLGLAACGPSGDDDDNSPEPGPAPVQVFLMAGQSNMVGHGPLTDAGTGDWPLARLSLRGVLSLLHVARGVVVVLILQIS